MAPIYSHACTCVYSVLYCRYSKNDISSLPLLAPEVRSGIITLQCSISLTSLIRVLTMIDKLIVAHYSTVLVGKLQVGKKVWSCCHGMKEFLSGLVISSNDSSAGGGGEWVVSGESSSDEESISINLKGQSSKVQSVKILSVHSQVSFEVRNYQVKPRHLGRCLTKWKRNMHFLITRRTVNACTVHTHTVSKIQSATQSAHYEVPTAHRHDLYYPDHIHTHKVPRSHQ